MYYINDSNTLYNEKKDFMNKDKDVVPEQAPPIILDRKYAMFMANNGKKTKQTRHIVMRMNFVRNGEECNTNKTEWCKRCLQSISNGTNNVTEDKLNPRLEYTMVILDN